MNLFAFVAVVGFCFSEAMPMNDCRDHYEYCGQWAKSHYCDVADYRAYMNLVCPFSCGICDDLTSGFSSSGEAKFDNTVDRQGEVHKVIPEIDEDFEDLGSATHQSNKKEHDKDENQSLSGSGDQSLFPAKDITEAKFQFAGESYSQAIRASNQQEYVSGSGIDPIGANSWAVVRVEPDRITTGSDRELYISRRSEKSALQERTRKVDPASGSDVQISGEISNQENNGPVEGSFGIEGSSGGNLTKELEDRERSDQDGVSGEDDSPFDNSSVGSELDSGCSSGDGCYESDTFQEGQGGDTISRSVIAEASEQDDIPSGSGAASGDAWRHPHFDVLAGPYEDKATQQYPVPYSSASGSTSELGNALHDIEDAIFEKGIPLRIASHSSRSKKHMKIHETQSSGSESNSTSKTRGEHLFSNPQQYKKINLMEKMMSQGKLQAFKISHITNVKATNRDQVPGLNNDESDLGKGKKVSFVLNQDFHDGYDNENSAAYNILANNVKKEVEKALGSNATVSEISFSEVREPAPGPRFSRILTSLKLLGDVSSLEKMVKEGSISNLVVDKNFFHAS